MGRRQTTDTTDTSSQYYRLIPRGKGFRGPSKEKPESDNHYCTAQVKRWQRELLEAYGYETKRSDDKARILYIKAAFINNLPKNANNAKKALKLLACDQSTLFGDDDRFYRSKQINAEVLSAQKKQNREPGKYQDQCVDIALYYYSHSDTPPHYAQVLLNEIIKEAAEKRMSVRNWLFSKGHMLAASDQNSASDDKQSDNIETSGKSSRWDTTKLDIESCQKDFHRLYLNCGKDFNLDKETCERFIDLAVLSYIGEREKLDIRFPEASSYRDESADQFTVPSFKRRLERWESLEKEYDTSLTPTEDLYKRAGWGYEQNPCDSKIEALIPKICNAICDFFECLNISARCCDALCYRVRSAFDRDLADRIPEKLVPIFLLNMVMACRHHIFSDPCDDPIQPDEILSNAPLRIPRIDQAKQRYAQLVLLKSLCKTLMLSMEEKVENLKEYVCLYGRNILSFDELLIWRQLLKGNYELLPQIGFPLCFLNYCEQCIPPHYEHLNYRLLSVLHQGEYHRFYRRSRRRLLSLSQPLHLSHKSSVDKYRHAWSNPCLRGVELEKILEDISEEIPIDLSDFMDVPRCNQEELKFLILETILQMQIRRDAIYTLLKGFSHLYHFPLVVAYRKRLQFRPKARKSERNKAQNRS